MKISKIILAGLLALSLGASSLVAGTPGITGVHSGTYDFNAHRPDQGNAQFGTTQKSYNWTLDFDNGTITTQNGKVDALLGTGIQYTIAGPKTLVSNGDGTYTINYTFQPNFSFFGSPIFTFSTTLDITETVNGLTIISVDTESNGVPGTISSSTTGTFPVELNWYGYTN
ncbi:hypothetical protein CP965_04080 [Halarcobacter mediterraneus]|uniref:Uncharacterized protein n=1 Tax=Halarcobacter mediterraneus TaxID=2023153 RepID=A0A4Q1B017_9BACT|nr:hypothetical protein [Halarcobacter mediterraneus]RXK14630.1 hypothetical protein CP965_04080 [Halarcobacter mediterraneus]